MPARFHEDTEAQLSFIFYVIVGHVVDFSLYTTLLRELRHLQLRLLPYRTLPRHFRIFQNRTRVPVRGELFDGLYSCQCEYCFEVYNTYGYQDELGQDDDDEPPWFQGADGNWHAPE